MAQVQSRESITVCHHSRRSYLQQLIRQSCVATFAINGLFSGYGLALSAETLQASAMSQASESSQRTTNAEIRKRTDASAESDRRAAQTHFEKLRNPSAGNGLSEVKQPPSNQSASETNSLPEKSSPQEPRNASPQVAAPQYVAPQAFYGTVLHEGPCTPCELDWQNSMESAFQPPVRSNAVVPGTTPGARPSKPNPIDQESTTKPSLPSKQSVAPQPVAPQPVVPQPVAPQSAAPRAAAPRAASRKHLDRGPLQIGSLRGMVPQEIKPVEPDRLEPDPVRPVVVAKLTMLPPPQITAIPASQMKAETNALAMGFVSYASSNKAIASSDYDSRKQVSSSSSDPERSKVASSRLASTSVQRAVSPELPNARRYTSIAQSTKVTQREMEPLRIGSLGPNVSASSEYASYYTAQEPTLLDQEALVSPSLSDSSSLPSLSQPTPNLLTDQNVQQAAFQGPGTSFGSPPSMGGSAAFQQPVVNAPVYPSTPTYQPPPVNNSVYPAPQVIPGGLMPSTSPGFSPQSGYGLPSYQNQGQTRGSTIVSGEPFVTAAPRQFDACYMVEPTYANTNGCASPPMANTLPYSGIPGTVVPPTMMPNQIPQGLYSNSNSGFRPLIGFGQDANNVQLGRGIFGQPKAYVPGQFFRNSLRYITP